MGKERGNLSLWVGNMAKPIRFSFLVIPSSGDSKK